MKTIESLLSYPVSHGGAWSGENRRTQLFGWSMVGGDSPKASSGMMKQCRPRSNCMVFRCLREAPDPLFVVCSDAYAGKCMLTFAAVQEITAMPTFPVFKSSIPNTNVAAKFSSRITDIYYRLRSRCVPVLRKYHSLVPVLQTMVTCGCHRCRLSLVSWLYNCCAVKCCPSCGSFCRTVVLCH